MTARAEQSSLGELLLALRTGADLSWLLQHAPDGDADAAVRRAWEAETVPYVIDHVLSLLHERGYLEFDWSHCNPAELRWFQGPCVECCDNLRSLVVTPTWSLLLRAMRRAQPTD